MLADRLKAFEAQFGIDDELRFRIRARRDRLLGLWVASQLGLEDEEAEAYALHVVEADLKEPGDQDVVEKVLSDFADKGLDMDQQTIETKLLYYYEMAHKQIDEGLKK